MVSVIVSTFNSYPFLILLLDSMIIFNDHKVPFEVVVCDSGSDPAKTQEILDLFDIPTSLVVCHNNYGAKQNRGVEFAKHDLIWFMNDDLVVTPNWLNLMVEDHASFSSQYKLGWLGAASCNVSGFQDFSQVPVGHCFHHVPRIVDGISMISKKAFWDVGGFDENAPSLQYVDDDFSCHLLAKDYVNVIGRARLHHIGHGAMELNGIDWRKDLEIGKEWFLKKHGRLPHEIYDEYLAKLKFSE